MRFMQIESVLQTKNRSELAKNWFSVALLCMYLFIASLWFALSFHQSVILSFRHDSVTLQIKIFRHTFLRNCEA